MNEDQGQPLSTKKNFLNSRNGAILRCAEIMVDSGRKDLAKQILSTTKIDRKRLEEIMAKNLYSV